MFRTLLYIILVVVVGSAFAWLASHPSDIVFTIGEQRFVVPLVVAVAAFVIAVLLLALIWWLVKVVFSSPFALSRKLKQNRKNRGEEALSQGLLAVLAGDADAAQRLSGQAERLLGESQKPLRQLLQARSLLLQDNREGAVRIFEDMRQDEPTKLVALQGLYQEAVRSGAFEAATQYAEEASNLTPALKWANRAMLDKYAVEGEWDQALTLFERMEKALPKPMRNNDKQKHRRAVLLCGQAMERFENHPDEARGQALKAHKYDPSFIPAANIAADILFRLNELRRGSKIIEAMWHNSPHPDLARTYINAEMGARAVDRLNRAKKLAENNPEHFESLMVVARAAYDAGELQLARQKAQQALEKDPRESVYLLLADIEDQDSNDQGHVKQWLNRAVHAAADPVWVADGIVFDEWAAVAPLSGRLDGFEWKAPMRHLGQTLDQAGIEPQEILASPTPHIVEAEVVDQKDAPKPKAQAKKPVDDQSKSDQRQVAEKVIDQPVEQADNTSASLQENIKAQETVAANPQSQDKIQQTPPDMPRPILDGEVSEEDINKPRLRLNVDDPGVNKEQKNVGEEQKKKPKSGFRFF